MAKNLIPNNITVSEQFARYDKFYQQYQQWFTDRYAYSSDLQKIMCTCSDPIIEDFLSDTGIKCQNTGWSGKPLSPVIEDEQKYMIFILKYS
jgi:hypothetical protein